MTSNVLHVRLPRRRPDTQRTYLHVKMRPLTGGALQPVRAQRSSTYIGAFVLGGLVAVFVLVAPLVFFLSVFGDPYGRGYVERRPDGLYAQLRACDGDTIHTVEVSDYDELADQLPKPFWSATSIKSRGADAVELFSPQPDFDTSSLTTQAVPAIYTVVINEGRISEAYVTVEEGLLEPGEVTFGGQASVSRADYAAMPNSDFGCPP